MNIKNLKITKKAISMALAGTLATASLTGCGNLDMWDTVYTYNKAIIFDDDSATIVKIGQWCDYDGEQIQIITPDGLVILTSSYDTKLINDLESELSAEDLIRSIKGNDVEIVYLDETNVKTRK